ncbi:MAG: hypothetical protein JRI34_08860 [Deltaproteobacteria bacterium]|nr:hypothetical protein [Deltaproteobacteria bacterium]
MTKDNKQVFIQDLCHQTLTLRPALRPDRRRGENGPWAEHVGATPPQTDGALAAKYPKHIMTDNDNKFTIKNSKLTTYR